MAAKRKNRAKGSTKRSYLKRFSGEAINTGPGKPVSERYPSTDGRAHANGIGKPIAETKNNAWSPRVEVVKNMLKTEVVRQGDFYQRIADFNHVILWKGRATEQRLYMNGNEVYIVLFNNLQNKVKCSERYHSVTDAKRSASQGFIKWDQEQFLAPAKATSFSPPP